MQIECVVSHLKSTVSYTVGLERSASRSVAKAPLLTTIGTVGSASSEQELPSISTTADMAGLSSGFSWTQRSPT